jgi:hypothetical protein
MGRLIIYEGSDEEIRKFLSSLPQQSNSASFNANNSGTAPNGKASSHLDAIARAFRQRLDDAASNGRSGQLNAMLAWFKHNGVIELTELWKASGVANQHDYGGIGSSLTRNMKKVGGMRKWYTAEKHPTNQNEWIYKVVPELVEPLKQVFSN